MNEDEEEIDLSGGQSGGYKPKTTTYGVQDQEMALEIAGALRKEGKRTLVVAMEPYDEAMGQRLGVDLEFTLYVYAKNLDELSAAVIEHDATGRFDMILIAD